MPSVGDTFFPKRPDTKFVVENITTGHYKKTVKVFNYPIPPGKRRDLLAIPEVSEADIRHALLKGELRIKLECRELIIYESNIDLLQFDSVQKAFLQSVGVVNGLEAGSTATTYVFKQGISLSGVLNGVNKTFTTPDKFLDGTVGANTFNILVQHNGRILVKGTDYAISESGGPGSGYDTITLLTFAPDSDSTMIADYMVEP